MVGPWVRCPGSVERSGFEKRQHHTRVRVRAAPRRVLSPGHARGAGGRRPGGPPGRGAGPEAACFLLCFPMHAGPVPGCRKCVRAAFARRGERAWLEGKRRRRPRKRRPRRPPGAQVSEAESSASLCKRGAASGRRPEYGKRRRPAADGPRARWRPEPPRAARPAARPRRAARAAARGARTVWQRARATQGRAVIARPRRLASEARRERARLGAVAKLQFVVYSVGPAQRPIHARKCVQTLDGPGHRGRPRRRGGRRRGRARLGGGG